MFRIDDPSAAPALPTPEAAGTEGYWTEGDPTHGVPATLERASWFNMIQEELRNIVVAAGITPSKTTYNQVLKAILGLSSQGGFYRNLILSASIVNPLINISFDELAVKNGAGLYTMLTGSVITIDTGTSGSGGLDTGALAGSTWYAVWVIYNPTTATAAGMISLSSTAPAMPAGFTYKRRVGWIRTDGTVNKYPLAFSQNGNRVKYKVVGGGGNVAALPVAASGVIGTYSTTAPTYSSVSLANYLPSTSTVGRLVLVGAYNGGAQSNMALAPNALYSGTHSNNPPPMSLTTSMDTQVSDMPLETTSVYVCSQSAGGALLVAGWEDNI